MNKPLILTSYAKFELNSLRNKEITMKLLITDIFGCRDKADVRNDYDYDYDVINYFAKFEKVLPHSIIIPSFMTVKCQMPELDREALPPPPPPLRL